MWVFSRTSRLPAIALGFRFYKRFNSTRIKGFCGVYRPREFCVLRPTGESIRFPALGISDSLSKRRLHQSGRSASENRGTFEGLRDRSYILAVAEALDLDGRDDFSVLIEDRGSPIDVRGSPYNFAAAIAFKNHEANTAARVLRAC
jgi:hypothetical protein